MARSGKLKERIPLDKIDCPRCGISIPITQALQDQLSAHLGEMEERITQQQQKLAEREREIDEEKKTVDKQVEQKLQAERTKLEQDLKKKMADAVSLELRDLREQVDEKDKKLEEGKKAELDLRKRERQTEEAKKSIEKEVQQKVQVERSKVEQEVQKKMADAASLELRDLRGQIDEKDKQLEEAQKAELDLRKRERDLEGSKKDLELQVARTLAEEREKIQEEAITRVTDEHRLKDLESEKRINDMRKQIEDLKRKAEQGSQQLQGEVQELDIEAFLEEHFPDDDIEPVPKGVRGADVLQRVRTRTRAVCGAILWESKRARKWSEAWIEKVKDDQLEAKADIAIIVTDALPKDIRTFGVHNGVWVTNRACLLGLAVAMREALGQVALAKIVTEGKDEKLEVLFRYLTGPEFRRRAEAVVETFATMLDDLNKEKRSTTARWGKQEKQIERAITAMAGMYGDLRGLIGSSMQSIPALEAGEEVSDEILGSDDVEGQ